MKIGKGVHGTFNNECVDNEKESGIGARSNIHAGHFFVGNVSDT
jgi:hypothetical protein